MSVATSIKKHLCELGGRTLRSKGTGRARSSRRRGRHGFQVAAEICRFEDRCMLSTLPNQFPPGQVKNAVPVSTILWNGGAAMPGAPSTASVQSPSAAGAMKTITLTNNGPSMIYPFIRGENTGQDPNATSKNQYYDPQDVVGQEYREYIGYQTRGGTFIGLPKGATITFQVPLVLWDGDNFFIATDPNYLTSNSPVYNYNSNAIISVAGTKPVGTTPDNTTTWVTGHSHYLFGEDPVVVFYRSPTPATVLRAAAAQLGEWTFRDPYLTNFITDPLQTFPLINYDVSYVNNLTAPVSIEASNVPITSGDRLSLQSPTYFGYKDYGWNPTNLSAPAFVAPIKSFINNKGVAAIGNYFGGKGWPSYYNTNASDLVIPSGANVFLDSPLTNARSPYAADNNFYLLSSTNYGAGPIQLESLGATYAQDNTIHFAPNYAAQLATLKQAFNSGETIAVNASKGDYPAGTTVTGVSVSKLTVTVSNSHNGDKVSGGVYNFVRPVNDYAATAITKLFYSWAHYYVTQFANFQPESATASYAPTLPSGPTNEVTLTSVPAVPLAVGMTVSVSGNGILPGTTILAITDPNDNPIGSANAIGDKIYLSLVPSGLPTGNSTFTFGQPTDIPYTNYTSTNFSFAPYTFSFTTAAAQQQALLFAGSVYAAMSAEAGALQPSPLPPPAQLVGQVIQFYANLPTDGSPGGKYLTGQVRDVVKSILRGVWNFIAIPDQSKWYPSPKTSTPNTMVDGKPATFGIYNLDPYVWFVHDVENMSGYAFSVDDDVANPAAPGPVAAPGSTPTNPIYNHLPSNLQIAYGGIQGFGTQSPWFPTIPWGEITTNATVSKQVGGMYNGDYEITLTAKNALTLFNQINNPGPGQVGAYVTAPGYIPKGTTLIFKGPNGDTNPQIVMLPPPNGTIKLTSKAIPIMITGTLS